MLPIGPIFALGAAIVNQAQTARRNKRHCRRLCDEIQALSPILKDIERRAATFPTTTIEMLDNALTLLAKDFNAGLTFVEQQSKSNTVKSFVFARSVDEEFNDIVQHMRDSKDIFMLAMVNKMDATISSGSPAQAPRDQQNAPGGLAADKPTLITRTPLEEKREAIKSKMEEMRKCFESNGFSESIKYGKELLKMNLEKENMSVVYVSIACAHAKMGSAEDCLTFLETAKQNGWTEVHILESDIFVLVQTDAEFITFRDAMKVEVSYAERYKRMPEQFVDQLTRLFDKFDVDGSATINKPEFRVLLKRTTKAQITDEEANAVFDSIDGNKSGEIDLIEYLNYCADNEEAVHNEAALADATKSLAALSPLNTMSQDFLSTPPFVPVSPQQYQSPPATRASMGLFAAAKVASAFSAKPGQQSPQQPPQTPPPQHAQTPPPQHDLAQSTPAVHYNQIPPEYQHSPLSHSAPPPAHPPLDSYSQPPYDPQNGTHNQPPNSYSQPPYDPNNSQPYGSQYNQPPVHDHNAYDRNSAPYDPNAAYNSHPYDPNAAYNTQPYGQQPPPQPYGYDQNSTYNYGQQPPAQQPYGYDPNNAYTQPPQQQYHDPNNPYGQPSGYYQQPPQYGYSGY